jgi:hypothetical protein
MNYLGVARVVQSFRDGTKRSTAFLKPQIMVISQLPSASRNADVPGSCANLVPNQLTEQPLRMPSGRGEGGMRLTL